MAERTHASRLTAYKNAGHGTTDLRRKRAELSVALRKQARDEQLLKRRALSPEAGEEVHDTEKVQTPAEIVQGLRATDLVTKTTSARAARRMLSREQNPPITPMVNAGVIKPLVEALERDDCPDLQFEAAWAITNIASGTHEHTMAVVDGGAIPRLIALLARGGVVGEQSAWALGNIAGDGPHTRDAVLAHGALPVLLPLMTGTTPASQLRTAVWTYSNFCRNKNPLVKFDYVAPALPYISELLDIADQDVLADACWALSYLTDGPNERIEAVQQTPKLLTRLVALLEHKSPGVRTPALRGIGNMLTGSDEQTDRCLDADCLLPIMSLLRCGKPSLMKEAAWAVSNILAGTQTQIQRAIDSGVLVHLIHVLANEDIKCQKEAAWAITNLCLGGTPEQLDALISGGFLEPYCALLHAPDHKAVAVVLDGLSNLLQAAVKFGQVEPLCLKLEEIGALDQIETLQQHENEQDLRRKRAELSVALRKQARDEQLLKRRALSPEAGEEVHDTEKVQTPAEIVQGLRATDLVTKTTSARAARRMLSREQNPPITPMVNAGVIKPLVEALERDDCPDLQFEAAWAITNIASGTHEHTMAVVDGGAIPRLIALLARGGVVGEQSAWALGNIAGDGPHTRDAVLAHGALPVLLPLMTGTTPASQLRTAVWTYSNFCRNKNPLVKFDYVAPALPYISELLDIADQDVLADACWALSYLTDGPNERIEAVQQTPKLLTRLVALLEHKSPGVRTPALRGIGNMLTGSDEQTDRCLDADCLLPIMSLLRCGKPSLMKEAAWAVSNILAGTQTQIQRAIDSGVLVHLIHVLANEDIKCQKEAAWAITNLCLGGTPEQLDALISGGFLEPYCALLHAPDHKAVAVVLDGLSNLLQAAVKFGQVEPLCLKLEEIGALDQIETLQQHENEQIYKKTLQLLDTYFSDQDDPNAQPAQTEEEYQFGTTTNENINF